MPIEGDSEEQKQTNEAGMDFPLLDDLAIQSKTINITIGALLIQCKFAEHPV